MDPLALVTGAGNGIGAAVAADLVRDHRLVLLDADAVGLERTAAQLGPECRTAALDVTDEAAVEALLDSLGEVPRLLVQCAALIRLGVPLLEVELGDWSTVLSVNVTGTFVVGRAVARRLAAAGGGAIVNFASVNALAPTTRSGSYSCSKAAVVSLTEQMALEWAEYGIRVNAVAPGIVAAGMGAPLNEDPVARKRRDARVPLGRQGTAEEIAAAVRFLGSGASSYVSGHTLVVDGALTRSTMAAAVSASCPQGR